MSLTLYSYENNHAPANKILVAAAYNGVEVTRANSDSLPADVASQSALSAVRSYDSRFPVLVTEQGPIYQTNACARYVAGLGGNVNSLLGNTTYEEGLVSQWIDFNSTELYLPVISWIYPVLGLVETSPQEKEISRVATMKQLEVLDRYLLNNTYLVGERLSLADIIISLTINDLYLHVLDEQLVKAYPNLTRWYLTLVNQPNFSSVLGRQKYLAANYIKKQVAANQPGQKNQQQKGQKSSSTTASDSDQEQPSPSASPSASPSRARHSIVHQKFDAHHRPIAQHDILEDIAKRQGIKLNEKDLEQHANPSDPHHQPHAAKDKAAHPKSAPRATGNLLQPR